MYLVVVVAVVVEEEVVVIKQRAPLAGTQAVIYLFQPSFLLSGYLYPSSVVGIYSFSLLTHIMAQQITLTLQGGQ